MPDIIQFSGVSHRYTTGHEALSGIDFSIGAGELVFLTGHSGAGKSTLLKIAAAIERPTQGQVVVNGTNVSRLKRRQIPAHRQQIGIIFQNFNLLYDRTVFDNVGLPLVIRGYRHQDIGRRVRAALDAVDLLGKERSYPITLSGGEQQRVGIARAIVTKPPLLIADEPTGNLDPALSREIMGLFQRFNEVGVSIIIATHAIDLIKRLPYRVIHLDGGQVMSNGPISHDEHFDGQR